MWTECTKYFFIQLCFLSSVQIPTIRLRLIRMCITNIVQWCSGMFNSTYMTDLSLLLTRITAAVVLLANTTESGRKDRRMLISLDNALVIIFNEVGQGGRDPGLSVRELGTLWANFAVYLCPCGGGNEGPLIYYAPDYEEIWGLCFR